MNKIKLILAVLFLFSISLLNAQAKYPKITDIELRSQSQLKKEFPFNIVLRDTAGNYFSSESVLPTKGKPLVLLFWMTTCGPCRQELNAIKANLENWRKEADFRILAVSMDFPTYYPNYIERVKKENWDFETVYDVHRQFCDVMPNGGLNGLPQLFIINEKGEIKYWHHRYLPGDEAELFSEIKKMQ